MATFAVTSALTSSPAVATGNPFERGPRPRPDIVLDGPVDHVAVLGDSLVADLRRLVPDAAPNDVVPEIARALGGGAQLDLDVENLGRPGQSLVYVREDFRRHDPRITTLTAAVRHFFGDRPPERRPQLVVIATSGIDVNVMAGVPIELLAPLLLQALDQAVDELATLGIQAVVLPMFPVADELYDRVTGVDGRTSARVDYVNRRLWASGLPMLFERFDGLDADGIPGADHSFFARHSADDPDDGIHPGATGQRVYVDHVVGGLLPLLVAANSSDPPAPTALRSIRDA